MHYAAMRGSVFRMQSGIDMAHGMASLGQSKLAIGGRRFDLPCPVPGAHRRHVRPSLFRDPDPPARRSASRLRSPIPPAALGRSHAGFSTTPRRSWPKRRRRSAASLWWNAPVSIGAGKDDMMDFDHGACWAQGPAAVSRSPFGRRLRASPYGHGASARKRRLGRRSGERRSRCRIRLRHPCVHRHAGIWSAAGWRGGFYGPPDHSSKLDERRGQPGGGGGVPDVGRGPSCRCARETQAIERASRRARGHSRPATSA